MQAVLRRYKNRRRSFTAKRKITFPDLQSFGEKFATSEKALIIFCEVPYEDLLTDVDVMPSYQTDCERYYPLLEVIPDQSYGCIIAMGLIEHLKDPTRLIRECHRILKPGGKVFISASSVFSVHRGPDDYFHVTRFGMQEMMSVAQWTSLDIRGSCGPFKTIGILLQRILLQAETKFFIRPMVYFLVRTLPLLDRFVIKQYANRSFSEKSRIDSMMPSNIQAIATR